MDELISLCGPLEQDADGLLLRIPMEYGGDQLAAVAGRIGSIDGDYLVVRVPHWLAERLNIGAGSLVDVDNADGKFNIRRRDPSA